MPTMSAVRNVADLGQPSAGPVAGVHLLERHAEFAHPAEGIQHRVGADALAIKFGVSLATTTPFPSLWSQNS